VVHKLFPFDRISVSLNNSLDNTIRVAYLTGMDIADIRAGSIIPLVKSVSEQLLERQSGILIRLESEEEIFERFPNILANYTAGIRSRISVPLFSKGGVIGGLHVESLESNVYTEEHVRLLERVGVQISGAIANAQLFAERKGRRG
jgi:GAF domain-containing protein